MAYHRDSDPLLSITRWNAPPERELDPVHDSLDLVEVLGKSGLAVLPKTPSDAIIATLAQRTGVMEKTIRAVYAAIIVLGS